MTDLENLDKLHVWHPFTQMLEWNRSSPLVIERGEGNYLIDSSGKRYLDGVASLWVNVHGHGHPHITEAIAKQAETLAHSTLLGLSNKPSILLAARLSKLTGLPKIFYSDSGSSAVEIALKMAYQFWQQTGFPQKQRFLHLENSYHGDTLGAVGVGGISLFHEIYGPIVTPGIKVDAPVPKKNETAAQGTQRGILALEAALRENSTETAALIIEPLVQGAAGIHVYDADYVRQAAELCQAHNVLLICDEVATGFGRTGAMFAYEHAAVLPDLVCVAKGLTGGTLPLAATLASKRIYEAFLGSNTERKTFFHGHTYTGNPIACAAALASLDLFDRTDVLSSVNNKADHLKRLLADQLSDNRFVSEIRQCGLMVGIELVEKDAAELCFGLREKGVILRPLGPVIVIMPPLSITDNELDSLVKSLSDTLGN